MSYLTIINDCLTELNFKTITSFSSSKVDQLKLRNTVNRLNKQIVLSENYHFRQKKTTLVIDDSIEYTNPATGKILYICDGSTEYRYEPDYTKIYNGTSSALVYSFYGGKHYHYILIAKNQGTYSGIHRKPFRIYAVYFEVL